MEKKEEVYLNSDLTVGDFDVFKISKRVILIEKDKHQLLINKGWIPFCQLDKPDKIVYKKMSKIGKTPRIAGLFLFSIFVDKIIFL